MRFPADKHFANIKLKKAFNKRVLKKLDNIDNEYKKVEKKSNEVSKKIKRISKYIRLKGAQTSKVQQLFDKYNENLIVYRAKSKKKVARDKIKSKRGMRCEACRRLVRHPEIAHMIKRGSFRGPNAKYNEFKMHRLNSLLLCADCHTDLDSQDNHLKTRKMGRLIKGIKHRNKKALKNMNKDMKITAILEKRIEKIDKSLKKELSKAMNAVLRKV